LENKLMVLKLFLDALDVSPEFTSVDDRKRLQKAVYLGQLSGVDLGYRFGWYIMGPYSPPLARDYYQLAEELVTSQADVSAKQLRPNVAALLARVAPLLKPPENVNLPDSDWLELLASYHYLRVVSRNSKTDAVKRLETQKPHVSPWLQQADAALREFGLLAA
jgi:uncharacterized protein YwgA